MPWPGTLAVVHSYLAHKTGAKNYNVYYFVYRGQSANNFHKHEIQCNVQQTG